MFFINAGVGAGVAVVAVVIVVVAVVVVAAVGAGVCCWCRCWRLWSLRRCWGWYRGSVALALYFMLIHKGC